MIDVLQVTPDGASVSHSATTTSSAAVVPLPTASLAPGVDNMNLLVTNLGPDDVYIKTAASAAAAVVGTSTPVLARSQVMMRRPAHTSIAVICPTSTATVVFTPGSGS